MLRPPSATAVHQSAEPLSHKQSLLLSHYKLKGNERTFCRSCSRLIKSVAIAAVVAAVPVGQPATTTHKHKLHKNTVVFTRWLKIVTEKHTVQSQRKVENQNTKSRIKHTPHTVISEWHGWQQLRAIESGRKSRLGLVRSVQSGKKAGVDSSSALSATTLRCPPPVDWSSVPTSARELLLKNSQHCRLIVGRQKMCCVSVCGEFGAGSRLARRQLLQ